MTIDIIFALSIVLIVLVCLNTENYTPKVNYALFMAIQWLSGGFIVASLVKWLMRQLI